MVPYQDVDALAGALLDLLARPGLRGDLAPSFARLAGGYTWEVTTRPLVEFCRSARPAPDRGRSLWSARQGRPFGRGVLWRERLGKGWHVLRRQGPLALWREVVRTLFVV